VFLTVTAGFTQTINDWYDKEIDAINEPYRPIPSGAISEGDVIAQIWVLLLGGLGIAYGLDVWAGHDFPTVLALSVFGSFISYIYSAPPLKLKQNGWAGNFALGECPQKCYSYRSTQFSFDSNCPIVTRLVVHFTTLVVRAGRFWAARSSRVLYSVSPSCSASRGSRCAL
jgi:UbiA prenyltransferase family